MKTILKDGENNADSIVRSRTVPQKVIDFYNEKIDTLEPHIKDVIAAEAVAKMDRIAEMEMTRAENLITHQDEINARPKREWFVGDNKQKMYDERNAKTAELNEKKRGEPLTGTHRLSRKKLRSRAAKLQMIADQDEARKEALENGTKPKFVVTELTMKLAAKVAKREDREEEERWFQKSTGDLDDERRKKRLRWESKSGEKGKKRKGAYASQSAGDGGMFDDDKVRFSKKSKEEPTKHKR